MSDSQSRFEALPPLLDSFLEDISSNFQFITTTIPDNSYKVVACLFNESYKVATCLSDESCNYLISSSSLCCSYQYQFLLPKKMQN